MLNIAAILAIVFSTLSYGSNFVDVILAKVNKYTLNKTFRYFGNTFIGGISFVMMVFNISPAMNKNVG